MASTVYNIKNITTFDNQVIQISPLKIKWLREFMDVYETLPDSTNDQESINILVECAKICMKQFAPEFSLSAESIEDNFDLQTLYLILEAAAGITKKEENKEEDIKNNVQESGTSWKTLDLASLESEAFLLGIWKDYQELEMSISMPELASLIQSKRKLDYEDRKFLAAIQGVDLDQANGEEDAWTKLKNKVFNGGRKDNDILTFQGQKAEQAGFGIGMGLDYEKID